MYATISYSYPLHKRKTRNKMDKKQWTHAQNRKNTNNKTKQRRKGSNSNGQHKSKHEKRLNLQAVRKKKCKEDNTTEAARKKKCKEDNTTEAARKKKKREEDGEGGWWGRMSNPFPAKQTVSKTAVKRLGGWGRALGREG
jgi:hypothetical protein